LRQILIKFMPFVYIFVRKKCLFYVSFSLLSVWNGPRTECMHIYYFISAHFWLKYLHKFCPVNVFVAANRLIGYPTLLSSLSLLLILLTVAGRTAWLADNNCVEIACLGRLSTYDIGSMPLGILIMRTFLCFWKC